MGFKCMQFEAMEYFELNGYFRRRDRPFSPGTPISRLAGLRGTQQAHRNTWNRCGPDPKENPKNPKELLLGVGDGSRFVRVLFLEAFDAAGGIDQFLLAGEERVAIGADFHADQLAFERGPRFKSIAAGAMHRHSVVIGMDSFFHVRPLFAGRSARMKTSTLDRVARSAEAQV